jgi:hypothetical protein
MDEDIKAKVVQWFQQTRRKCFEEGIQQLVHQWDACLSDRGDYF